MSPNSADYRIGGCSRVCRGDADTDHGVNPTARADDLQRLIAARVENLDGTHCHHPVVHSPRLPYSDFIFER
jgi:hypothetical protein